VAEMAQRVAVMYAGQVVEERAATALFSAPQHPYTAALMAAMPERSEGVRRLETIPGVVPGAYDRPAGCLFAPRCAFTTAAGCAARPALRHWEGDAVRCVYPMGDTERDAHRARDLAYAGTAL